MAELDVNVIAEEMYKMVAEAQGVKKLKAMDLIKGVQRIHSVEECPKPLCKKAIKELIPKIKDQAWFFDSELLLRAEAAGYEIHQEPVRWVDDPASTVNVADTAWKDIKGLVRVRFGG